MDWKEVTVPSKLFVLTLFSFTCVLVFSLLSSFLWVVFVHSALAYSHLAPPLSLHF